MKRYSLLVFLFICTTLKIFSQSISGEMFAVIPGIKDFNNQQFSGEVILNADHMYLETDAGIRFNKDQFQFTTSAVYMPELFLDGLNLGGGVKYHVVNQNNLFYENDFLISARGRYTTKSSFSIEVAYNMIFKLADIVSVRPSTKSIFNFNSELEVLMSYNILENLKAYLNITSYDYFDYPLLGTPFVKLGADYNFYDRFSVITDYTMKLEDMFTSTTCVSAGYFRIGAKVDIW